MQIADEIEKLNRLREAGTLTEDEFRRAKERLVGGAQNGAQAPPQGLKGIVRSRRDRWIAGVCGGLGETTAAPAWLYRLLFTLVTLAGGAGILIYLLMWIFVPLKRALALPDETETPASIRAATRDGLRLPMRSYPSTL